MLISGTHSKSLIPGSDCPEGATFLNVSFLGEAMGEATTLERAVCVFEQNTGVPLRRHMSYARGQGAFYGGMSDSVLTVRSVLTIVNYDYIVDFVFHQVRFHRPRKKIDRSNLCLGEGTPPPFLVP